MLVQEESEKQVIKSSSFSGVFRLNTIAQNYEWGKGAADSEVHCPLSNKSLILHSLISTIVPPFHRLRFSNKKLETI